MIEVIAILIGLAAAFVAGIVVDHVYAKNPLVTELEGRAQRAEEYAIALIRKLEHKPSDPSPVSVPPPAV